MDWKSRQFSGLLALNQVGQTVTLMGWVDTIRDHGHLLFFHVRDVTGVVQVVAGPQINPEAYKLAELLRSEFVVQVTGKVLERSAENKNPNLPTGSLEVEAQQITILSRSETPPFQITEKESGIEDSLGFQVDEDIRLTYRYLDLRRRSMQKNIIKRAEISKLIRDYLSQHGFLDIETPMLTKSTPEGARDYLVPSRVHSGQFYALPQSPQLFKQLLMVSGFERYYQIVRCFRDEDLRPNRQPEFTQVDLEASFIDESYIYSLIEGLLKTLFDAMGKPLETPFPRISYDEAMNTYGSDAPDIRFGLTFVDVTEVFENSEYKIMKTISQTGGNIKGIVLKGLSDKLSKNMLQEEWAKKVVPQFGGKGMTWMRVENGELQSNVVQFLSETEKNEILTRFQAVSGDVIILIADITAAKVNDILGKLRLYAAEKFGLIPKDVYMPCWVVDFPMFDLQDGQLTSTHHPFTQAAGDIMGISSQEDCLALRARAYDVVINGQEIGGGSIRIHRSDEQHKIFDLLGLSEADIQSKFGFFVKALSYGAPPHGGLALGLDRLMTILLDESSIREVIPFPKNRVAFCPLTEAPSAVSDAQLNELKLRIAPQPPKAST